MQQQRGGLHAARRRLHAQLARLRMGEGLGRGLRRAARVGCRADGSRAGQGVAVASAAEQRCAWCKCRVQGDAGASGRVESGRHWWPRGRQAATRMGWVGLRRCAAADVVTRRGEAERACVPAALPASTTPGGPGLTLVPARPFGGVLEGCRPLCAHGPLAAGAVGHAVAWCARLLRGPAQRGHAGSSPSDVTHTPTAERWAQRGLLTSSS